VLAAFARIVAIPYLVALGLEPDGPSLRERNRRHLDL
jgi:hypothetical protein